MAGLYCISFVMELFFSTSSCKIFFKNGSVAHGRESTLAGGEVRV